MFDKRYNDEKMGKKSYVLKFEAVSDIMNKSSVLVPTPSANHVVKSCNVKNLCTKSALPSQIVMIGGRTKHSNIFEISDRLVVFYHLQV